MRRELPRIEAAIDAMIPHLSGPSDVGQKKALTMLATAWIADNFSQLADAKTFTGVWKRELDLHLDMMYQGSVSN